MGVSGKWIKALVGLKKSEKPESSEKDGNKVGKFRHQRKHDIKFHDGKLPNEFKNDTTPIGDNNDHTNFNAHHSPSTSQQVHDVAHSQLMREELAAIRIQAAFRRFLARRAVQALKGVVMLQALVRGHAVRKQAAITLRCLQALVKVQAHIRARHVRMALENQSTQQKHQQKLADKVRVRETEQGWCDSVGSVEEIQAKILKREQAAAKRKRVMAYALAHQWQAGSRQQPVSSGFKPDKSSWGWSWLERWMAIRPWENRHIDINLKDGITVHKDEIEDVENGTSLQLGSANRKPFSLNTLPSSANQRTCPTLFNACDSSPSKSEGSLELSSVQPVRPNSKVNVESSVEEASAKPASGSRSHSHPKERTLQVDKQAKKRLSLPNNGGGPGSQRARHLNPIRTNVKGTLSQKPSGDKLKLHGRKDVDITKLVP